MNELIRLFIVVLTNAGGEGKTTLAVLFYTILSLMDEQVAVLDSDAGNYSAALQVSAAGGEVRTIGWSVSRGKADRIVSDHDQKHAIFDTGANQSASHREVVDLLPELRQSFANRGYRTIALLPLSTNKVGAAGALKELAPKVEGFDQIFVRVDRDGSNNFVDDSLDEARTIRVDHLQPGYQDYVRQVDGLRNAVSAPPAGYERAADHIAAWMRNFAAQPLIHDLLGDGALKAIDGLGRRQPLSTRFGVNTAKDVSNDTLEQNARRSRQLNELDKGRWSAATFRSIADRIDAGLI